MSERANEVAKQETLRAVNLFHKLLKVDEEIKTLSQKRYELLDGITQSMALASQLSFGGKTWTEEYMRESNYKNDTIEHFWRYYELIKGSR